MERGAVVEQSWLLRHEVVRKACLMTQSGAVDVSEQMGSVCFLCMSLLFLGNLRNMLFKPAVPEEQLNTC